MNKILLTGGFGRLGTEFRKYLDTVSPTLEDMDILKPETYVRSDFDMVIHCAAYVNLVKAEKEDKTLCYMTNVLGTKWLREFYKNSKFVYISSEYASNPANWYSWTKLWGENVVKEFSSDYLIVRTSFKPRPFQHPKACADQWTIADYVDVIAPKIVKILDQEGSTWVGTGRKTTYELALQTNPDVVPCLVEDITDIVLPKDYITNS
mgnify:CR=1 FL=1